MQRPSRSVTVLSTVPVASFRMETLASPVVFPEGSRTAPCKRAVKLACARNGRGALAARKDKHRNAEARLR
jgi:hypothetical protein